MHIEARRNPVHYCQCFGEWRLPLLVVRCPRCSEQFLVNHHVSATGRVYKTSPYWQRGYSSMGIYCSLQTRKRLEHQFLYWDNVDAIMVSLGELFPSEDDKRLVETFAKQAFGGYVKFVEGHSAIELLPSV